MRLECECLRGGENVLKNVCDAERIVAVSILSSLITRFFFKFKFPLKKFFKVVLTKTANSILLCFAMFLER